MQKIFLLFILWGAQVIAQNKTTSDTLVFTRIFGCSCCNDTLPNYKDKRIIYVLTKNNTILTAYKTGKTKWLLNAASVFAFNDAEINCMDYYEVDKRIVIRLFMNKAGKHLDINPKNGQVVHYKN